MKHPPPSKSYWACLKKEALQPKKLEALISGPTCSGKSTLISKIVREANDMFNTPVNKI